MLNWFSGKPKLKTEGLRPGGNGMVIPAPAHFLWERGCFQIRSSCGRAGLVVSGPVGIRRTPKFPEILFLAAVLWLLPLFHTRAAEREARSPGESVRLQLKWHHQFQFAGYYAAQARGYYREEGLDVTILEGDAEHPPVHQVLNGQADFGVSDADVLKAYLEGKPLVVLAAIFQHSPYILMTRADSGIRTPTDLRGKTIMLSDEQGIAQLRAVFRREGMSLDAVRVIPHQWNNDLLINGQVDAISAYSTVEPFQLRARGVEPAMIRAMDYGVDFYGDTLFTTRREVERHPERVAAFRRASLRGWEYAMAHPDEIVELILQMPGVAGRGLSREMLRYEAGAMRELILPGLIEMGHMNPGRWQAIARTYATIGWIPKAPAEDQLRDFVYHPDPPRETAPWLAPLLISLGGLGMIALWIAVWNLQLRRAVALRTAALHQAREELVRANAELEDRVAERTAKLSEAVAELEKMSYSIIHDMRAPLRAIQGFGQILEADPESRLSPEGRDLVARMGAAARRMDALIRDVLSYSKIVRGEMPLHAIDTGALARGVVQTYPDFQPPNAEVTIAPDLPAVIANEGALAQCFSHLLNNAVKFAKPGQTPRVEIRGEKCEAGGEGCARIVVQDQGVGIGPEYRAKLFGMFQQASPSRGGTGIGLAIVKKAVERMGGRVGVESNPGKGSRFWIELKSVANGAAGGRG
jgi:signal transduction histidine kinase